MLHLCQPSLAAAQIYRLLLLHPGKVLRKQKNHIQVNDRRQTNRWHDLRVIYKVPFRFNVRKGERNKNIIKRKILRNVLLYIQWQSQLSSQPSTHSFDFRMSISNTSVKCSSYIYLYIMKELKMFFFPEQFTALWTATGRRILIEWWSKHPHQSSLLDLEAPFHIQIHLPRGRSKHKLQFHAALIALR